MVKTYLCFEVEAALFLIPLELVKHILPGKADEGGKAAYGGHEVCLFDLCRLWGGNAGACGKYLILLNREGCLCGFRADEVMGIFELEAAALKEMPEEVTGGNGSRLRRAVYLESLDEWAFVIEPGVF